MAAVTKTDSDDIMPPDLFQDPAGTLSRLTAALSLTASGQPKKGSMHSFEIVAEMAEDHSLAPGKDVEVPPPGQIRFPWGWTMKKYSSAILKAVSHWEVDVSSAESVKDKVDQLSWFATLLYGVTGLQPGKPFKADFFTYVSPTHMRIYTAKLIRI